MNKGIISVIYKKYNVGPGDKVKVELFNNKEFIGVIMPKHEFSAEDTLILKLPNGYNIGIDLRKIKNIELIETVSMQREIITREKQSAKNLPKVIVLAVGGTILSRVDYRTGAVRSAVTADELMDILPEIVDIAEVETKILMNKYSEHLTYKDWEIIAKEVYNNLIRNDISGIVLLHGTDTLGYTAAALSFAVRDIPKPVVLVGSQRSSDRPSSDAAINLIAAIYSAVNMPFAHVVVAMHNSSSDDKIAIHIGTRVRKNHSSRRDAFKSIDISPIAYVHMLKSISHEILWKEYRIRDKTRSPRLLNKFSNKVALLKFYPGMPKCLIDILIEDKYDAIIIEGTGLGHLGEHLFDVVKAAIREGVKVYMTTQCIWGRTNLNVYDTGRKLLAMGVVPLENMLSETALVKAMWALGNFTKENLDNIMLTNYEYEIVYQSPPGD